MAARFPRRELQERLAATFGDAGALAANLRDTPAARLPDDLRRWLTRLMLLHGVPINYLVPDERMLPPESIRFFYVNMSWVDAMIDGAFSIGRNLTPARATASENLDRAVLPAVRAELHEHAPQIRARALGVPAPVATLQMVSGFLMRSSVVTGYPGIGVNVYPRDGVPPVNPILLPILRLEQLGPHSNTILCLVDGDAWQVDVHQPSEGLHYGIDRYEVTAGQVHAEKILRTFTRTGSSVTLSRAVTHVDVSSCFRSADRRTLMMRRLAAVVSAANAGQAVDAAELGFEMTEGVGQVSFKRTS